MPVSVDAEVLVLFKRPVSARHAAHLGALAQVAPFEEVRNPDLHCWMFEDGVLECRNGVVRLWRPALPLKGRLFLGCLGRYWTPDAPWATYGGPPDKFRQAVAQLLAHPDIEQVWYGKDLLSDSLTAPVSLEFFEPVDGPAGRAGGTMRRQ